MVAEQRVICASGRVAEGEGFRFSVDRQDGPRPAFVIRFDGRVHAYLNRCAHAPVELDWMEGEFFDYSGRHLVCSTHGATYLPDTGHCIAGPCKGRRLVPIPIEENHGQIWLKE